MLDPQANGPWQRVLVSPAQLDAASQAVLARLTAGSQRAWCYVAACRRIIKSRLDFVQAADPREQGKTLADRGEITRAIETDVERRRGRADFW